MRKLYVVGIGPGAPSQMTLRAREALEESEVIAGYGVYVDLVRPYLADKEYIITPMRREVERCRMAIDSACAGRTTALISSGDAGIYGMAGLVYELAAEHAPAIEVIPGVTAAVAGAALLGAPLGHDFAVISLSDALTPWERIEKRLRAAAEGEFCMAIYNPRSKKRPDHLRRAAELLLSLLPADTPCGAARAIGREGESCALFPLSALGDYPADMFTTIFVGTRDTAVIGGRMITRRGYQHA